MNRKENSFVFGILACLILSALILLIFAVMLGQAKQLNQEENNNQTSLVSVATSESKSTSTSDEEHSDSTVPSSSKSMEEKQAVMDADLATMSAYGLYYDYVNLSLVETVQAYMKEFGIGPSAISFSYKNTRTGDTASMNDTQAMTAGSTYKLPLNMLVVDEVDDGKLSLTECFDISQTGYELLSEHNAYMSQFPQGMTIPDMQKYSLVYSENTPAYALADRLGGMAQAYTLFGKYGQSKGDIKTIELVGNKTTTDYYIQVLDYLWNHQEKYADIIYFMEISFPRDYYKAYFPNLRIVQKPGYVREARNVDAIVFEETPYLVAIYTAGLGGSTTDSTEINGYGYTQLLHLTYVINQWHRINGN